MKSKNKNQPLISIITINYNQLKVTCEFLESCKTLSYSNYEIIVVDNDSTENPSQSINEKYPEVRLIINSKNLGFTGGNNVGIAAARGDYLFIVNNDTEVTPDLLSKLIMPFNKDEHIGMVSPKIRYYSNPDVIQYAGFKKINPITGRNSTVGQREKDIGQYNQGSYTHYAHGAAMMVKREVVEQIGAFDHTFFIYYEELDWSSRASSAGFKIYYQSEALIFHKESITMGKDSPFKAYYHDRNRILFMRKHTNKTQFVYFSLFLILVVIPKKLITYLLRGQLQHLKNFIKGLKWHLNHQYTEKSDFKIGPLKRISKAYQNV